VLRTVEFPRDVRIIIFSSPPAPNSYAVASPIALSNLLIFYLFFTQAKFEVYERRSPGGVLSTLKSPQSKRFTNPFRKTPVASTPPPVDPFTKPVAPVRIPSPPPPPRPVGPPPVEPPPPTHSLPQILRVPGPTNGVIGHAELGTKVAAFQAAQSAQLGAIVNKNKPLPAIPTIPPPNFNKPLPPIPTVAPQVNKPLPPLPTTPPA
jgi:hypothetical protein